MPLAPGTLQLFLGGDEAVERPRCLVDPATAAGNDLGLTPGQAARMTGVDNEGDEEALLDHVVDQVAELDIAQVACRGIADVGWHERFVDPLVAFQARDQGPRLPAVAGVVDQDFFSVLGLAGDLMERGDHVLVGRPALRYLVSGRGEELADVLGEHTLTEEIRLHGLDVGNRAFQARAEIVGGIMVDSNEQRVEVHDGSTRGKGRFSTL